MAVARTKCADTFRSVPLGHPPFFAHRGPVRWLAAVVVLAGCSKSSISTKQVATFGYHRPPAIGLATSGPVDLADAWRAGAHRAIGITDLGFVPDAELCEVSRAKALDEVVIATLDTKSEADPEQNLVMSTHAVAKVRILETATCGLRREVSVETQPIRSEVAIDEAGARRALLLEVSADAERETRDMFVRGPQVVRQAGREIEVEHDNLVENGDVLYVKKGENDDGKRVVVERAAQGRATLVSDDELPPVDVGDELHRKSLDHRLTLFPTLSAGRIEGGHTISGIGVTARWSSNQLPLLVEVALNGDLIPDYDSERLAGGVAAGLRWPLGPVNPVVVAEAGLSHATQNDAESDGGFVGLGAGIELWLGKLCLFGDLRYRWQIAEDWQDSEGEPLTVAHPVTDYALTVVQVGIGWRR
jgi:hypothetical protein